MSRERGARARRPPPSLCRLATWASIGRWPRYSMRRMTSSREGASTSPATVFAAASRPDNGTAASDYRLAATRKISSTVVSPERHLATPSSLMAIMPSLRATRSSSSRWCARRWPAGPPGSPRSPRTLPCARETRTRRTTRSPWRGKPSHRRRGRAPRIGRPEQGPRPRVNAAPGNGDRGRAPAAGPRKRAREDDRREAARSPCRPGG